MFLTRNSLQISSSVGMRSEDSTSWSKILIAFSRSFSNRITVAPFETSVKDLFFRDQQNFTKLYRINLTSELFKKNFQRISIPYSYFSIGVIHLPVRNEPTFAHILKRTKIDNFCIMIIFFMNHEYH